MSTGNFSLISQNVAVWAVLGVGMTFVIITSGIDLSVGSVLVFCVRGVGKSDGGHGRCGSMGRGGRAWSSRSWAVWRGGS